MEEEGNREENRVEKPWDTNYPISPSQARQLIKEQFPYIGIESIRLLGEGFDNTVIQVDEAYVFRFPRKDSARDLLLTENQLLPAIAGKLPLSIPEPIFFGKPTAMYPYPFTGYKLVRGKAPKQESLISKVESARKLAFFLKELHQFPTWQAEECGVKLDNLRKLDIEFRLKIMEDIIKLVEQSGYYEQVDDVRAFMEKAQPIERNVQPVLVHGDIHIRNVLLDESGVLSGIIDWGDVHLGDYAIDLSFLYSYFPLEVRQEFFKIYGEIDAETEELARFRAIYMLVTLFPYAIERQDESLLELIKNGLNIALEAVV